MHFPKLNFKRPDENDINWLNIEPDKYGSFGLQLFRSEFANWTTCALKSFFSYFGCVTNTHIDKTDRFIYIRFKRKIEAYNAMTCIKSICKANPALNTKLNLKSDPNSLIYIQILNINYSPKNLAQTFQSYIPTKILPHKMLKCVYVIYFTDPLFVDKVLEDFLDGEHPFKVSREDPAGYFVPSKTEKSEREVEDKIINDLHVTLSELGEREIAETKNLVHLSSKTEEMVSLSHVLNNKYITSEILGSIYGKCFGLSLDEALIELRPNSEIQIICKENLHQIIWGIVMFDETEKTRIFESSRLLNKTLFFFQNGGLLEELHESESRCGAMINGVIHRAYLVEKESKIVFLVDKGSLDMAESLWSLPDIFWSDYPPSLLRPFVVINTVTWSRIKKDEVIKVKIGSQFPPPEKHIFTIL